MIRNHLFNLMNPLTNRTVLAEMLAPALAALVALRPSAAATPVLDMKQFLALGVLRHLQRIGMLRTPV